MWIAEPVFLHHITDQELSTPSDSPLATGADRDRDHPRAGLASTFDSDGEPRDGAQVAKLSAQMPTPTKRSRSPARFGPQNRPEGYA